MLVEGVRAVRDVLAAGVRPDFAVVSPRASELGGDDIRASLGEAGVEVARVEDRDFAELAGTETPQGLLIVVPEPAAPELPAQGTTLLVLDGVQDPGNVGTLIRTAAGLGVGGVIALDGTADPWGARAVRASAGAAFRIPVFRTKAELFLDRWRGPLWVAELGGPPLEGGVLRSDEWALVLGSEGSGPRAEVAGAADLRLTLPLRNGVESLNVASAGAILLSLLTLRAPGDPDS